MNHANQIDDEAHALPRRRRDRVEEDKPICAACRSRVGIRADAALPGVLFCNECWERAHEETELGDGD
jgi:RNA polymerase-binding transcription factor DksA